MMSNEELIAAFQAAVNLIFSAWEFQSMKEHHSVARFSKCESVFPSVLRLKNGLESLIQNQEISLSTFVSRNSSMILDGRI